MGVLASKLFTEGDPIILQKLEDCAQGRPNEAVSHFTLGQRGEWITKVQQALKNIQQVEPGLGIPPFDANGVYDAAFAKAISVYKDKRNIRNFANKIDNIVGIKTIKSLDSDAQKKARVEPPPRPKKPNEVLRRDGIVDQAFEDSRAALRTALGHLRSLRSDIAALPASSDPSFNEAMLKLLQKHKRNLGVISKRLVIIPDPTSRAFGDVLDRLIRLCERNLALGKTILAAGTKGLCDPSDPRNAKGLPHALTVASQPDPKTHVCEPFFINDPRDLRRDVITHEYFHILGLEDISVANTDQAFRNANTIAQIVAFLTDRSRQANSDGGERAVPPLPSP